MSICAHFVLNLLQSIRLVTVLMEMFVWWEAPISMRVEWRCASMTSGGQCVMTFGTALMLLWSASNWDMHTLEVSLLRSQLSVHIHPCKCNGAYLSVMGLVTMCQCQSAYQMTYQKFLCRWHSIHQCPFWCW